MGNEDIKNEPLVSVITPAYNAAAFLADTIRSVIAQTYENWEMVVVDDGSTEGTATIIKAFAKEDPRVKYLHQENAGQSAARNTALRAARGKYIAFLDADDLFMPEKLREQVAYLESHPHCGFLYCELYHFYGNDRSRLYRFVFEPVSGRVFERLLRGNFINPLAVVLRKEMIDRYGAFDPTFRWIDEYVLWLKLAAHKVEFCYLPTPLAYYRLHKESFTNRAGYFKGAQEQYMRLFLAIKSLWLTPAEAEEYGLDALIARTKRRLRLATMMDRGNVLGGLLTKLYFWRRKRRLRPVAVQ